MPHAVFAPGLTALITGGGSGIGLAVAQLARRHGMHVALVDINPEALSTAKQTVKAIQPTATPASGSPPAVEAYTVDVSRVEQWHDLKVKVEEKFGLVHLLMLNAGVGGKGSWEDGEYFRRIMDTNLFGPINGLTTFLSTIRTASSSAPTAIILTGSKQGITNPPGNPAYNASKAAIRTLAEHLSYDLRETSTSVHLLVPGWTFTGMTARGSGSAEKPAGAWEPAQVAEFLAAKMDAGAFYVVCPDNEVTEDLDRRRTLWAAGDLAYARPPLSRWREDWKERAQQGIEQMQL